MEAFEELKVWQRSSKLAADIYRLMKHCKDYSLRDQMLRSSISISSNIAEGFERNSKKQFAHFLQIAKGSCGELRSQLYICSDIDLFATEDIQPLLQETKEISRMIQGLIIHCKKETVN